MMVFDACRLRTLDLPMVESPTYECSINTLKPIQIRTIGQEHGSIRLGTKLYSPLGCH